MRKIFRKVTYLTLSFVLIIFSVAYADPGVNKQTTWKDYINNPDAVEVKRLEENNAKLKVEKEKIEEEYRKYYNEYVRQERTLKTKEQINIVLIVLISLETLYIIYKKVKK